MREDRQGWQQLACRQSRCSAAQAAWGMPGRQPSGTAKTKWGQSEESPWGCREPNTAPHHERGTEHQQGCSQPSQHLCTVLKISGGAGRPWAPVPHRPAKAWPRSMGRPCCLPSTGWQRDVPRDLSSHRSLGTLQLSLPCTWNERGT